MNVTLEPCPHCGTMLTPSLVADIRNGTNGASCPRAPKAKEQRVTTAVRTMAAALDDFNEALGRTAERLLRLLNATDPEKVRRG